jgi:hypothetical protein
MTNPEREGDKKRCTKCNRMLPLDEFPQNPNMTDGHLHQCKFCVSEASRDYREKNIEKIKEKKRKYYWANREKIRVQQNTKRAEKPEFYRERDRKWRSAHHEQVLEHKRQDYQKHKEKRTTANKRWFSANTEHAKEKRRIWKKEHPDMVRENNIRRRAQKVNLPFAFTAEDETRALEYFNGCCAVCGRPLWDLFGERKLAFDHWIAINDPRPDNPGTVPWNMVPLCHGIDGCNTKKHDTDPPVWLNREFGKRKATQIIERIETFFDWVKDRLSE